MAPVHAGHGAGTMLGAPFGGHAITVAAPVTVVSAAPPGMLEAVAGLALLGALAASIASGLSFAGIGAAFRALVTGLLVRWVPKNREY